jgi:hypothetical protein
MFNDLCSDFQIRFHFTNRGHFVFLGIEFGLNWRQKVGFRGENSLTRWSNWLHWIRIGFTFDEMKQATILFLLLPMLMGSCASEFIHTSVGTPFSLRMGGKAEVQDPQSGTSLSIAFESVEEDSRCPEGAQCFWAGRAVVRLTVNGSPIKVTEGMLPDSLQPVWGNYRFVMQSLEPYPKVNDLQISERKKEKSYRARVQVNYR